MGIEEDLLGSLKHLNLGGKAPRNDMVKLLMWQVQMNALQHLRNELDKMIDKLAKQGVGIGKMGELNPYVILGVKPDAPKEVIEKAYRSKAYKAHPDRGGTHEEMVKINAAWEAIQRLRGWK